MKKITTFLFLSLVFIGCNFVTKRKNDPYDIDQAKKIATEFYSSLNLQKYDAAIDQYSKIAVKEKTRDSLKLELQNMQSEFGLLDTYIFIKGSSFVIEGTKQRGEYELIYDVKYQNQRTQEKLLMIQEKGLIKILAYRINPVETDTTSTLDSIQ
jgi:hypothetical protein